MCGIAGVFLKRENNEQKVQQITDILQSNIEHRGPDAVGFHIEKDRGFLNRRLAIVGIKGGEQPIYTDNKELGIVYNGEVYNYKSLRESLQKNGVEFNTHTDTEVVLKHFAAYGTDSFKDLEGMFAICIWDQAEQSTYLVRDGFGMKPLYIYEDEDCLVYCSELSALIKVPELDLSLDPSGIKEYLTFRYATAPLTIFKNIRRMIPGTYLKITDNRVSEHYYKDILDIKPQNLITSFEEAKQAVHDTLLASLEKHLIGEVPIALLLSGGVDSSILAALLHELGTNMTCFNIGFDSVNEFEFSSSVADKYGFPLHNVEISTNDVLNSFDEILVALDEPIADPACFPLHLLCKEIKKTATVVLSGEGADELFAGYPQYKDFTSPMSEGDRLPSFLQNSYYFLDSHKLIKAKCEVSGWQRTKKYYVGEQSFDAMSNYDFKTWVPDNLMMKADKIAMRSSLEGRFPFLDDSMISLSRMLPDEYLISEDGITKHVLKETFREKLPKIILDRPKMGFTVPVSDLIVNFKTMYLDALEKLNGTELAEIVDFDILKDNLRRFLNGETDLALLNWTSFVLVVWIADRLI